MNAFRSVLLVLFLGLSACASAPKPPPAALAIDRQLQLGARHYQAGRVAQARQSFTQAIRASELYDDAPRLIAALLADGASALTLGDFDAAEGRYRRAQAEARHEHLGEEATTAALGLAETARRRGRGDEALSLYRAVGAQPALSKGLRIHLDNGLALCLLAQGRPADAEALLGEAEALARDESEALQATTLINQARVALARADLAPAEAKARQALAIDRRLFSPLAIAADHELLAEILERAGRSADAQEHRRSAQRIRLQVGPAA